MRRITALFVFFCIAVCGPSFAANQIDIHFDGQASYYDTLFTQLPAELRVSMENDYDVFGMSLGFQIWSPDGCSWDWLDVGGYGTNGYVSIINERVDIHQALDMTGFLVTEQNIDETGRDTIMGGGVAMMLGIPAGPMARVFALNFRVFAPGLEYGETRTLCFDSCFVPPSGAFVFVNQAGQARPAGAVWPAGGRCAVVKRMPQFCPTWESGPTALSTSHCGPVSATYTIFDAEGDDGIFDGITDGAGTLILTPQGDDQLLMTYTPAPADVGTTVTVTLDVTDAFHLPGQCSQLQVAIDVTNNAPTINCGQSYEEVFIPSTFVKDDIVGADADSCDVLQYHIVSASPLPVGPYSMNPNTGEFSFTPTLPDMYVDFIFEVEVTDGYATAKCTFVASVITLDAYTVKIEKAHDVLQGHYVDLDIDVFKGSEDFGAYDFLIAYDALALTFMEASLGQELEDCGWEYFSYRHGVEGNCGDACPSGLLRIIALAETNNGPNHPTCYNPALTTEPVIYPVTLASMTFYVSNDRTLECQYVPVRFFWGDCGDNAISSIDGDSLYLGRYVYDFEGNEISDYTFGFPTYLGPPESCLDGDKVNPFRMIDFWNGGVDIVCADSIDARGDINVNGIPYEIADAVMFTQYFINGLSQFSYHVENSIASSDVNADGIALSVADLVYLIRIITGDAPPYPKALPDAAAIIKMQGDMVTYSAPVDLGAARLIFDVNGDIGEPILGDGASGMDMKFARAGNQLRVLIYDIGNQAIPAAGDDMLLYVPGAVELIEAEVAAYDGYGIDALIRNLPTQFAVRNYPNPFNPETSIEFDLPIASQWSAKIYNITGQEIREYTGYAEAGTQTVLWDGADADGRLTASGIYLYTITAGKFSATKKMMLLK